jgi:glycosyltransferase involved in cell wall biosynthesis
MKIAVIEPYYGGSHKSFLDALTRELPFEFSFFTLPARKWKWRMRLAAPLFAEQFNSNPDLLSGVDAFLCSPFLDVATFKGMLSGVHKEIPVYTYFHENQFAYPVQVDDERDFHFALTNLTTALASDKIAFNSQYNLDSFLQGAGKLIKKIYDMKLRDYEETILNRAVVLYPGLDFSEIDNISRISSQRSPVIVWNHRWEHDKNPEFFFNTIYALDKLGLDFKIKVLGESFRRVPEIFSAAKSRLNERIIHYGYVESRQEYLSHLKSSDIIVSTAKHEFYGISVIEAVRAGCRPLLPARLSYPELFETDFLYEDSQLVDKLTEILAANKQGECFTEDKAIQLTQKFSWEQLRGKYHRWMSNDNL